MTQALTPSEVEAVAAKLPLPWFQRQRQDFIRAQLITFGQIRRSDIADRFEITVQVASADISKFMDRYPDAIIYDGKAKCYILDRDYLKDNPNVG